MRIRAGVVLGIGLALWAAAAAADTFYKYRDKNTGRDAFVNRLDQVPRKYRSQAKIVLDGTDTSTEPAQAAPPEVIEIPVAPGRPTIRIEPPPVPSGDDFRRAMQGKDVWKEAPLVAGAVVDAKLAAKGAPPLDPLERANLGSLLVTVVIATIVAGLAALVAWIVIIVTAVRDGRLWWALFIFLFSPLGYVYVFVHGGKGRAVWKTLCSLGMLSPALVGLVGAWRFYAWFSAVIQARGGKL